MEKQIIFKTSTLGGFDKKAVTDYIYTLNEENSAKQTQLKEQLAGYVDAHAAQAETLRQITEHLAQTQGELESTRTDLSRERGRAIDLDGANEGLQGEIARQRERIAQMQGEIERMEREISEMKRESLSLHEREEEIENSIASAGKLMFDARNDAAHIVAQARKEAEEITATAHMAVHDVRSEAEREAAVVIEKASREAERIINRSMLTARDAREGFVALKSEMDAIHVSIVGMMSEYEEKSAALGRRIESSGMALSNINDSLSSTTPTPDRQTSQPMPEEELSGEPAEDGSDFFRGAASVQY